MLKPLIALGLAVFAGSVAAQKTTIYKVPYSLDTLAFEGRMVLPVPQKARLPLIVLFPDWMGMSPTAQDDAQRIAAWGYAVFIADLYGKDAQPKGPEDAGAKAGALKNDVATLRARAQAGLEAAKRQNSADTARVAALGYCFGGMAALELARSGAPLRGTASVHGNLKTPLPGDARNIHGSVLVLQGADDPYVPREEVGLFRDEMNLAKVDWQLVEYSGAVHAFTNPRAGNDPGKGAAYNPRATERAYKALRVFFDETLRTEPKGKR